jgi:hypothetical protein
MYMGRDGEHVDNVQIIAIGDIYRVSVSVYFIYEGQVTQLLTIMVNLWQGNVFLLISDELVNDHYNPLLSAEVTRGVRYFGLN